MSRRAAIVEEFDDDTDLPLPSHPLPNTGTRGPLLQEMHISDDEFEPPRAGPASPSRMPYPQGGRSAAESGSRPSQQQSSDANRQITDITPYKSWTCIYPIYVDAKRPYGTGQRRVERAKSLWWPLSKDIADAANRLGLGTLHEVNKSHPRDWENPGRVRVQWKKDGKLMNPIIKTKKQLLEMICLQLQTLKPENIPKPPYSTRTTAKTDAPPPTLSSPSSPSSAPLALPAPNANANSSGTTATAKDKGKQPAATKSKSASSSHSHSSHPSSTNATQTKQSSRKAPVPPEPYPPLANRVSAYSPAISSGVLIDTVKAGMNALEGGGAVGGVGGGQGQGQGQPQGAGAKGKRKVVRVRG